MVELNSDLSGYNAPATNNLAFFLLLHVSYNIVHGTVTYIILLLYSLEESSDLKNATEPVIYAGGPPTKSSDSRSGIGKFYLEGQIPSLWLIFA